MPHFLSDMLAQPLPQQRPATHPRDELLKCVCVCVCVCVRVCSTGQAEEMDFEAKPSTFKVSMQH